jgi:hypothetical protein
MLDNVFTGEGALPPFPFNCTFSDLVSGLVANVRCFVLLGMVLLFSN